MSPETLTASVEARRLLASEHEGLQQRVEHRSASFTTGDIFLVLSESFNLPSTDKPLLLFLLRKDLAAGEVSQKHFCVLQWMQAFLKGSRFRHFP